MSNKQDTTEAAGRVNKPKIKASTSKPITPRRNIRSFEADDDVEAMLQRADGDGIKLVFICNNALRAWLTNKGYARKRDPR